MKKLRGNISFGFESQLDGLVRIEIGDNSSGCRIAVAYLTYEQFGWVCGAKYVADIPIELNDSGVIGKIHEHKTETIHFTASTLDEDFDILAKEAVRIFEVDGWKARLRDLSNHHHHLGNGKVRVAFDRYVDKTDDRDVK